MDEEGYILDCREALDIVALARLAAGKPPGSQISEPEGHSLVLTAIKLGQYRALLNMTGKEISCLFPKHIIELAGQSVEAVFVNAIKALMKPGRDYETEGDANTRELLLKLKLDEGRRKLEEMAEDRTIPKNLRLIARKRLEGLDATEKQMSTDHRAFAKRFTGPSNGGSGRYKIIKPR